MLKVVFQNRQIRTDDRYREVFKHREGQYMKLNWCG